MKHEALFIDGRWTRAAGRDAIEVVNPYTEAVIGSVPEATPAEIDAAVAAARAAFPAWAATSVAKRDEMLGNLHRILSERANELAALITSEVGTPLKISQRMQVPLPLQMIETTRAALRELQFEETVGNSTVVREPVGVVACVTPWNYPLHQLVSKVVPALAAGCTVVMKPSEVAPLDAFLFADALAAAGCPPGAFNLVTGYGPSVGEYLVRHPGVDMVSFTGSTQAGRRIASVAAETVKRVALELGGKSPSVILPDADLAGAVKTTVNMCYLNAGQTCTALTRMLVPKNLFDAAAEIAVATARSFTPGDPMDEKTRLGPLISARQRERVQGYIRKGADEGAPVLLGGIDAPTPAKGYFVAPTVFGPVKPGSTIAQEEIFGPVLSILTYEDEEEAVAIANGTIYGLAAAVWSADGERATRVARRIRAGQVDVNGGPFNPAAPFGGFKQSGIGRESGRYGLEEFLEVKAMQFRPPAKG